jgi:TPR repeat protein
MILLGWLAPLLAHATPAAECATGDHGACWTEGWRLHQSGDDVSAKPLFERGCALGVGGACAMVAALSPNDGAAEEAAWERGCELQDARSCYALAGRIRPTDAVRAEALHTEARRYYPRVANDDATAAFTLGWLYETGTGGPPDAGLAARWYAHACSRDKIDACTARDRVAANDPRGACWTGDAAACWRAWANTHESAPDVALGDAQHGCDLGHGQSCAAVATTLSATDAKTATAWWGRACALNDGQGCLVLGRDMRTAGAATTATQPLFDRARAVLEPQARSGDWRGPATLLLGLMLEAGLGCDPDPGRAARMYEDACRLGEASACATVQPPEAP